MFSGYTARWSETMPNAIYKIETIPNPIQECDYTKCNTRGRLYQRQEMMQKAKTLVAKGCRR